MADCFVIMPVSTPETFLHAYGDDSEHFHHVLEYLFVPAIERAGLRAIPPIAQGADVIHAEIIKNLESCDLVLCDISTLNPNVFFELGCRTALNKPVCYVKDNLTLRIPFDTGIINHHTYSSSLAPWELKEEVGSLASHIVASAERSNDQNKLWQYFGLRSTAHAAVTGGPEADKVNYLIMQVEALKKSLDDQTKFPTMTFGYPMGPYNPFSTYNAIDQGIPQTGFSIKTGTDWPEILSAAERDLKGIMRVRKHPQSRAGLDEVKSIINAHIRDLGDLVKQAPAGVDVKKAERVLEQLKGLRAGKDPEAFPSAR